MMKFVIGLNDDKNVKKKKVTKTYFIEQMMSW